jgi:hypothetical protein
LNSFAKIVKQSWLNIHTDLDHSIPLTEIATPSSSEPVASRVRDLRLDFWRGLCLIDMVLVHMVYEKIYFGPYLGPLFSEYARFAAGGFILIAGMSIGAIFLPRALNDQTRRETYVALIRRAGWILLIHYLASITFYWLDASLGRMNPVSAFEPELWLILTFRAGGDLLPFYVVMIALSPLMLEMLRRKLNWLLAVISLGLFITGQWYPNFGSIPLPEQRFHVILWQCIFVAGLLCGSALPKYDALAQRTKLLIGTACAVGFVLIFWSDYGLGFGLPKLNLGLTFHKIPLSDGEVFRYFTLIGVILVFTDLIWLRIRDSSPVAFVRQLGRKSLAVYVAHVWIVSILATYAWRMHDIDLWHWQGLLAIPAILLLWCYAWAWERWGWKTRRRRPKPTPPPILAATGS